MAKHHVTATINGDPAEFLCTPEQTLLDVLRDVLYLTGSKEGCASGDCGACSVILDGRLVCSCLVLGVEAEGRSVELADAGYLLSRIQLPPARVLAQTSFVCAADVTHDCNADNALWVAHAEQDRVDVSLTQWMALTPHELVQAHLDVDRAFLDALPKEKHPIV
jgi:hypothetical protein